MRHNSAVSSVWQQDEAILNTHRKQHHHWAVSALVNVHRPVSSLPFYPSLPVSSLPIWSIPVASLSAHTLSVSTRLSASRLSASTFILCLQPPCPQSPCLLPLLLILSCSPLAPSESGRLYAPGSILMAEWNRCSVSFLLLFLPPGVVVSF